MPLNKSTGNMYKFITHTWNTIKGECPHGCSYLEKGTGNTQRTRVVVRTGKGDKGLK